MVDTIKVFYLKVVAEGIPRPPYCLPVTTGVRSSSAYHAEAAIALVSLGRGPALV